jgi:hypothetical protein
MEGGAMERLLELNQRLAQLAIEPNMHAGEKPVKFVDPRVRAEWAAGLLRNALVEGYGFSGRAKEIIEEHDILAGVGGDLKIVDLASPSDAPSVTALLMGLASLSQKLDAQAEGDTFTE